MGIAARVVSSSLFVVLSTACSGAMTGPDNSDYGGSAYDGSGGASPGVPQRGGSGSTNSPGTGGEPAATGAHAGAPGAAGGATHAGSAGSTNAGASGGASASGGRASGPGGGAPGSGGSTSGSGGAASASGGAASGSGGQASQTCPSYDDGFLPLVHEPVCSHCHGANPDLPDWGDYGTAHSFCSTIGSKVASGAMPPTGTLTNAQRTLVADWVRIGCPETAEAAAASCAASHVAPDVTEGF